MFMFPMLSALGEYVHTLSGNLANQNLYSLLQGAGLPVTQPATFVVDLNGFNFYSTSTGGYALQVGTSWQPAATVVFRGSGFIYGMGGAGGRGADADGGSGQGYDGIAGSNAGPALLVDRSIVFEAGSNVRVYGGGGGGGGGGGSWNLLASGGAGGSGGGGGQSFSNSSGGAAGFGALFPGGSGAQGTVSGGGAGGNGSSGLGEDGTGGTGGSWGSAGSAGEDMLWNVYRGNGAAGGAGGNSIVRTGGATYSGSVTTLGPIV